MGSLRGVGMDASNSRGTIDLRESVIGSIREKVDIEKLKRASLQNLLVRMSFRD
jgi:hypothetical protein